MLSFTRRFISPSSTYTHILRSIGFSSGTFIPLQGHYDLDVPSSHVPSNCEDYCDGIELPQLVSPNKGQMEGFNIELVDSNLWPASFIFSHNLNGMDTRQEKILNLDEDACDDEILDGSSNVGASFDFDEIENLRIRKKLVFQLDKGSKEYEECEIDFHLRKTNKKRLEKHRNDKTVSRSKNSEISSAKLSIRDTMTAKVKHKHPISNDTVCETQNEMNFIENKKTRTPTFNQLTDPYHLPFCLDIFVTKGSVRASVIHRVTSKVVAVAHSISKDMKFDLTYKKDATACAAVGQILAQRAIEDDIHNIVYTPRKGDKIEGKLQIVLQSIIDHGVDVKVKLKQKNQSRFSSRDQKNGFGYKI